MPHYSTQNYSQSQYQTKCGECQTKWGECQAQRGECHNQYNSQYQDQCHNQYHNQYNSQSHTQCHNQYNSQCYNQNQNSGYNHCHEKPHETQKEKQKAVTRIAVANLGTSTVTMIDEKTEDIIHLDTSIPTASPMYISSVTENGEMWVGMRGLDLVYVYDYITFNLKAKLQTGKGIFHMWTDKSTNQLWVVCDVDKTFSIFCKHSKKLIATVPMPVDLQSSFTPHDITLTPQGAVITLFGIDPSQPTWLIRYDTTTFKENARLQVPGVPHVSYSGNKNSQLYVACQGGNKFLRVNPYYFNITGSIDIPGAHGLWPNDKETIMYVTNIGSSDGVNSIYKVDLTTFQVVNTFTSALKAPHNPMLSSDERKLFITHTFPESNDVSVYDLDYYGNIIGIPRTIKTGSRPIGIMRIPFVSK